MTRVATASEAVTTVSEIAAAAAAALEQGLEDSSESETDNNDETGTTDKFLLLIGNNVHTWNFGLFEAADLLFCSNRSNGLTSITIFFYRPIIRRTTSPFVH